VLDVAIARRGRLACRLPDGLDELAQRNLITSKAHDVTLDRWATKELICDDVAYRKLVNPSPFESLPGAYFCLFVVHSRFPHKLRHLGFQSSMS
jgi:hypothetical protein